MNLLQKYKRWRDDPTPAQKDWIEQSWIADYYGRPYPTTPYPPDPWWNDDVVYAIRRWIGKSKMFRYLPKFGRSKADDDPFEEL